MPSSRASRGHTSNYYSKYDDGYDDRSEGYSDSHRGSRNYRGHRENREYGSLDGRSSRDDYSRSSRAHSTRDSRRSRDYDRRDKRSRRSDDDDDSNSKNQQQRQLTSSIGKGPKKFLPPDPRFWRAEKEARQHRRQKEKENPGFDWTQGIVLALMGAATLFTVDKSLFRREKKDVLDESKL